MAEGVAWSRRQTGRARALRNLLRNTRRALDDVAEIITLEPEINAAVHEVSALVNRSTALVILGSSARARSRLLHCLLGRRVLPEEPPRGCRWLRIQYGSTTQAHLILGNSEFEIVEELECNKRPWDTLPLKDLLRQDETDLSTILELEINNAVLKDGIQIVIPPDLDTAPEPNISCFDLKNLYPDFYEKRELLLKKFNPVYLYALDRIGKNIFYDTFCDIRLVPSKSDEDFWSTNSFYYMTRSNGDVSVNMDCDNCEDRVGSENMKERAGLPHVFDGENCQDLRQIKQLNPSAQVQFILFSDSQDLETDRDANVEDRISFNEATESAEDYFKGALPESDQDFLEDDVRPHIESPYIESIDKSPLDKRRQYEEQCSFLNELLDQWEMMSPPPSKHSVKSQWLIIDDEEMTRTTDQKTLAPFLANVIQNTKETCSKSPPKQRGEFNTKVLNSRSVVLNKVLKFAHDCLQQHLLEYATKLGEIHVRLVQQFILASFDLARELQVVPKKIQYVARQEQQLYESLNEKFTGGKKKEELLQIIREVLHEMREEIDSMDWSVDDVPCHQDLPITITSIFYDSTPVRENVSIPLTEPRPSLDVEVNRDPRSDDESDVEEAETYDSFNFEDYDIINCADFGGGQFLRHRIDREIFSPTGSQADLIRIENELSMPTINSQFGISLFDSRMSIAKGRCCKSQISVKQATLDVQRTVLSKLSRKISLRLEAFVDCLKDNYFGTLQRCLSSLEGGLGPAGGAVGALLGASRDLTLQPAAAFSLLHSLLDSLRNIFQSVGLSGSSCCPLAARWRRAAARHALHQLADYRLARAISNQILERLSKAHERFQSALSSLETTLNNRLHHTEDVRLAIRKKYAPRFACLCLESTSMCDLLMYGTPELGREIGRGQYGVVYGVRGRWAGQEPLAAKSVVPADQRHYHELAMECFYTRSIPPHPRIVRLIGSVASGGSSPNVLLVSRRLVRDLQAAVRAGLRWPVRLQVALDIVDGIRYLHSLGLVHRDIKMKNVLLDQHDRASLTDLGFCAAEALMSGSVVGTPVHMAPELLNGGYDASVDVYAFGILFWYICAGNVKLPTTFEALQNKEQLWSKVKKGLRPERLPHFSDECWDIMQCCWASEPEKRALLGDVQPRLEKLLVQCQKGDPSALQLDQVSLTSENDAEDDRSLYITGLYSL